ncbi:MAG: FRG domain-containing protein [Anaerolineaceae bacterium]|nr:FRG domain-containing protein [Anaerolineaceae bacterium]
MAYIDFSNWDNFVNKIFEAEHELNNPRVVWYRGQHDYNFKLIPSLIRLSNGLDKEADLFEHYQLIANKILPERKSDWEYLTDMQHYNLPTRLLDWTDTLGIALFFAVLGNSNCDAAVYVLDPELLNVKAGKTGQIINLNVSNEDESGFNYRKIFFKHQPVMPHYPVAAEAKYVNDRIFAQQGKFTIHGNDTRPIDEIFPDCVKKIRLNNSTLPDVKKFLKISGINEFTVFPDIVGLAPYLRDIVGL